MEHFRICNKISVRNGESYGQDCICSGGFIASVHVRTMGRGGSNSRHFGVYVLNE